MRYNELTSRQLFSGIVALTAVVAANLLAVETEHTETEARAADAKHAVEIPAAPAPVTGIRGPDLGHVASVEYLDDIELVVPVLNRPEPRLPDLPEIDSPWLGYGIMAAPATVIEVDSPDLDATAALDAPSIEIPVIERPELPAPPAVR